MRSDSVSHNTYLYLPIEIKNREFHAKLLLACFAVRQGFRVMLGELNEMRHMAPYLPRGIIIDKSVARTKVDFYRKYLELGYHIAAWCEEGLVFRNNDAYLKERISTKAFDLVDLFFGWGDNQIELLAGKIDDREKIVRAGNPRFDILRKPYREIFRPEAVSLEQRYGKFILINTNFSRFNHFHGKNASIGMMKKQGRIKTAADEEFCLQWSGFLEQMFHHFMRMMGWLSRTFSDHTFVVRPHPSENQDVWKREMQGLPNVTVIHHGSVIPWIMASRAVIHNSCNTGVEAFMLDKPVVAYRPIKSVRFDSFLPNSVSIQAENQEELTNILAGIISDPDGAVRRLKNNSEIRRLACRFIAGLEGPYASQRVVQALTDLVERTGLHRKGENGHPPLAMPRRYLRSLALAMVRAGKQILKRQQDAAYHKQKFSGLDLAEMNQALSVFQEMDATFASIRAVRVRGMRHCFCLLEGTDIR